MSSQKRFTTEYKEHGAYSKITEKFKATIYSNYNFNVALPFKRDKSDTISKQRIY
ncbi:hypothetical protein [Clostridium felsineum]|uniref:Uncharacterized protein n=1 Tax=Clostridium felsineum TaxID=36839 RepID=A0A1S8LS81_9CLOT|nr:hypothetical protein [Clostridium felsineum]URZ04730.1 hypothetical protein CLROS_000390 [Clostridium felsineum]URZ09703.1 hypothetical protein CROST_003960 [Clostridium felsineum]